jgi:hypothetical protein
MSVFPEARRRHDAIEAGAAARVAGGAGLADFQEDGVLIAIDADFIDVLFVA